jgi:hypothetical protein
MGPASSRWLALREVLGASDSDDDVRRARASIMSSPWIRRLMRDQDPAGWWVNPKNSYQPRGLATVWHLQLLAELGAPGEDPRIAKACDRVVMQNGMTDGGFACGVHAKRYSEECLTGHMLYTLARLGQGYDPRSLAARDWLLERQLPDGGWNCRPAQSHSSFISTLGATKAMALMPGRDAIRSKRRAVEFLLAHKLFFSHTTDKPVKKFWPPVIAFPVHYWHDLLHPLRTLAIAGAPRDPRADRALDLLEQRATRSMRWAIDHAPEGMTVERAGAPSKWVTAAALGVLTHFGRVRVPTSVGSP